MQMPKHEGIKQGKRCSEIQELVKASLEYIRHDRKQVKWNTKRKPTGQADFVRALRKAKRQAKQ